MERPVAVRVDTVAARARARARLAPHTVIGSRVLVAVGVRIRQDDHVNRIQQRLVRRCVTARQLKMLSFNHPLTHSMVNILYGVKRKAEGIL